MVFFKRKEERLIDVLPEGGAVIYSTLPYDGAAEITAVFASAEMAEYAVKKLNIADGHHVDERGNFLPLLQNDSSTDWETAAEEVSVLWSDYVGDAPAKVAAVTKDLAGQLGLDERAVVAAVKSGAAPTIEDAAQCFAFLRGRGAEAANVAEKAKTFTTLERSSVFYDGFQSSREAAYSKHLTRAAAKFKQ